MRRIGSGPAGDRCQRGGRHIETPRCVGRPGLLKTSPLLLQFFAENAGQLLLLWLHKLKEQTL